MESKIMPTYQFLCDDDDGGCSRVYEETMLMCDLDCYVAKCPSCGETKFMRKVLNTPYVYDSSPRTVGTQAERNTQRTSNDERSYINAKNTAYKTKKFTGSLPDGGSLYPLDSKGNRIPRSDNGNRH